MNETERNHEIHDKEMLAIIRGLEVWRHLLEGAQYKFEIWMDHKNLEYFMKAQKLNRRQARWALYLSWFDFTLKHVVKTKMGKADGLSKDKDVVKVVEEIKRVGVKELRGNEWKIEGDLVLKEGKVYVLKDEELRVEIIRLHHDMPTAGHGGRWKTVELVTRNYWWPGVTRDMGKYVEGCDLCQ